MRVANKFFSRIHLYSKNFSVFFYQLGLNTSMQTWLIEKKNYKEKQKEKIKTGKERKKEKNELMNTVKQI